MSNSKWQHTILSHGPLQTIVADKIWTVTGRLPRGSITRTMVVYRLPNGRLLLHSPIALGEAEQKALEALGPIDTIIIPNGLHRLDGPRYKQRYPQIRVLCPRAAQKKVEEKVKTDASCEEALPALGISVLAADGLKPLELAYELPSDQGAVLVVTDMLMNLPIGQGFEGWLLRIIGSTGFFGMTRVGRLLLLKDRAAFQAWLRRQASKQLRAILPAHGQPIVQETDKALLAAAARL